MASMRQAAQDVLDDARDGIGWIALWKDGKGWMSKAYYPDMDRQGRLIFEDYELESLRTLAQFDHNAILVNSYYHNLGPVEAESLTRDQLAAALRWQYDTGHALVIEAVENCAK